jgi:hypothetical protein
MEKFGSEQKEEKIPDILNNWDLELLTKGTPEVVRYMYKDFGNDFPDIIILPDSSARPLVYLFKPIFEELNKTKQTKIPQFVFFSTITSAFLWDKDKMKEDNPELIASVHAMNERTKEIQDFLRKNNKKTIAILDDINQTQSTINIIRSAFEDEKMPACSIGIFEYKDIPIKDEDAKGGYVIDPDTHLGNPDRNDRLQFSWNKEVPVGVKKEMGEKYVKTLSPDLNPDLALKTKKLRDEMKALGEKIATEILESLS